MIKLFVVEDRVTDIGSCFHVPRAIVNEKGILQSIAHVHATGFVVHLIADVPHKVARLPDGLTVAVFHLLVDALHGFDAHSDKVAVRLFIQPRKGFLRVVDELAPPCMGH